MKEIKTPINIKIKEKMETLASHLHLVTRVMLGKEKLLEITTQIVTVVIKEWIEVTISIWEKEIITHRVGTIIIVSVNSE